MSQLAVIILAAGLGKRTLQPLPKVTLKTADKKPLLAYVLEATASLNPVKTVIVVGHGREHVESIAREMNPNIVFAYQAEQKGTGHATLCGVEQLGDFDGPVLIVYGDMPLITTASLQKLSTEHYSKKSTATLLTIFGDESSSFGRILRDAQGNITGIREAKDCSASEHAIRELNAGFYLIERVFLEPALKALKPNNSQGELYLTDVIVKAAEEGQRVESIASGDAAEGLGVNDLADLQAINNQLRARRVLGWIKRGVTIPFPETVSIDDTVTIGSGVTIGQQVNLHGTTVLGNNVQIDGSAVITNCTVADGAHLKLGLTAEDAIVGAATTVGPFANLRAGTVLKDDVRIGNFVEIKKSVIEKGAKVPHLSYVGDASIGEKANLGAGTITCNYDGYVKSKTVVGKGAFVGSNSSLVAPVTIGEGALVGAGSTITKDVPADSLSLTRAEQRTKEGWAKSRRDKMKKSEL